MCYIYYLCYLCITCITFVFLMHYLYYYCITRIACIPCIIFLGPRLSRLSAPSCGIGPQHNALGRGTTKTSWLGLSLTHCLRLFLRHAEQEGGECVAASGQPKPSPECDALRACLSYKICRRTCPVRTRRSNRRPFHVDWGSGEI